MNKIEKFLRKLDKKNSGLVEVILLKVENRQFKGLDNKKLKGFENIFRIRKGKIRIIYQKIGTEIEVLVVDKKKDDTYKLSK